MLPADLRPPLFGNGVLLPVAALALVVAVLGFRPGRRIATSDCLEKALAGLGVIEHYRPPPCSTTSHEEDAGGIPVALFAVLATMPWLSVASARNRRALGAARAWTMATVLAGAVLAFRCEFAFDIFETTSMLLTQHLVTAGVVFLVTLDVALTIWLARVKRAERQARAGV